MNSSLMRKHASSSGKKIFWVSFSILDVQLHKRHEIEFLRRLSEQGYDVWLVAVRSRKRFTLETPNIRVFSIPLRYVPIISPFIFSVIISFFLPIYVLVSKPDFIITEPYSSVLGFISTILFFRLHTCMHGWRPKVILDIRSTPVETVGLRGRLQTFSFDTFIRLAKSLFDGITIITFLMKKEICKKFGIDPSFVGVWSDGPPTGLFKHEKYVRQRTELRKRLGLSNKFVVFHHGVFSRNRGIIETVNAISITKNKYPNIVLFLLGKGPVTHDLKQLVQRKKLQDNVIIHDVVDYMDVPKYIAMCDIGIVPLPNSSYWRYQRPSKLLEYLAMKKVVVVTDIPAHREIIEDKKCGVYVSSTDQREIARAMIYAFNNKKRLNEWGESGREIVIRKYSWEKVVMDLENYLSWVKNRSN